MTVADLQKGEIAIIVSCSVKRLCDLGLSPGVEIRMVKPGSPCIVSLFNRSIGMGIIHQNEVLIQRE